MAVSETGSTPWKKNSKEVPDTPEESSKPILETDKEDTTKVVSTTTTKSEKNLLQEKKRKVSSDNETKYQNDDASQKEDNSNSEALNKEKDENGPDTKRRKKQESHDTNNTDKSASFASFKSSANTNPFAAALEKAKKQSTNKENLATSTPSNDFFNGSSTTFGSTFGSGNTKGSIFGSSSSKTSIFGGSIGGGGLNAFGSTTPFTSSNNSNGGGSILWGSSLNNSSGSTSTSLLGTSSMSKLSSNKTSQTSILMQESSEPVKNGEENEESILQYRAKLFRLIPKTSTTTSKSKDENKQQNWREVGIGPLRILKTKKIIPSTESNESANALPASTFRIVQRRECTPGGPGTKVILNIVIGGDLPCTVSRQADKFVQLATVSYENINTNSDNDSKSTKSDEKTNDTKSKSENESLSKGDPVMYLFKVKTMEEANDLQKKIEECIDSNNK